MGVHLIQANAPHPYFDRTAVDAAVESAITDLVARHLGRPPSASLPPCTKTRAGRPRVLFVINPTDESERASVELGPVSRVTDLLDGTSPRKPGKSAPRYRFGAARSGC